MQSLLKAVKCCDGNKKREWNSKYTLSLLITCSNLAVSSGAPQISNF